MSRVKKRGFLYKKNASNYKCRVYFDYNRQKMLNINEDTPRINYTYLTDSYIKKIILRALRGILERKNLGRPDKI